MFSRMIVLIVCACVSALAYAIHGCGQGVRGDGDTGLIDGGLDPDGDANGAPDTNGDSEPATDDDPFVTYTPDPDVYSAAPDEAVMLEEEDEDGQLLRFPANQLAVLLVEDTPRAEAERLAGELGGTIVGQVPSVDLYQFELPTTSLAELEEAVVQTEADPNVQAAGFNFELSLAQMCPAINDNEDELILADRCAFEDTEYYQAITMFDIFRPHVRLHPVTVAVIDSGVEALNGQFSAILAERRLINLLGESAPWEDPHPQGHGTGVIGLIAADDNGSSINGIASRFLDNQLRVAVGPAQTYIDALVMAEQAALAGADIINLSFTSPTTNPNARAVSDIWPRIFGDHPDVLFVVSAGDRDRRITAQNPPAGLGPDQGFWNVITVGGTMACSPLERSWTSNYGPGVTIGAPGVAVPTVPKEGGPGVRFADGTSYAAPQVTSLAAILKSINPRLSADRLIDYILHETYPTTAELGASRLTFTFPIEHLLLDIGVGDPVRSWIDPLDLGNPGTTGLLLSRICPAGVTFHVEEYGTFEASEQLSEDHLVFGVLNSNTFSVAGYTEDERFSIVSGGTSYSLRLGEYLVMDDPPADAVTVIFAANDGEDHGGGLSGTVILESCQIVERDPFNGVTPFVVNASGAFEGVVEMLHLGSTEITIHTFEGFFSNVPLGVGLVDVENPIVAQIEMICEGGRGGDEPDEGEAEGEADDE
jgi:subtilisin family serine protease